jgi:chemotaxis protein CheC
MMQESNTGNTDDLFKHFDVLREVSNIGAGNAATALASLLNRKVNIGIPKASLLDFANIGDEVGGLDQLFVGILIKLNKDVEGMMIYLLSIESANTLIESMMNMQREPSCTSFTEIEYSLLQEIGNILSGSYLSSLGVLTNLQILPSIPYMAIDMAGAILSVPAIEFGKIGDQVLFIESQLGSDVDDKNVTGYFILVPEAESFSRILRTLGVI